MTTVKGFVLVHTGLDKAECAGLIHPWWVPGAPAVYAKREEAEATPLVQKGWYRVAPATVTVDDSTGSSNAQKVD